MVEFTKDITKNDISLKERIVIINFPFSFVDDEEKIAQEPNVFKLIDRTIKQKFETDNYRRVMIDILFEYYKLYQSEGLIIPQSVKSFTNNYFGTQSILGWFKTTYIENDSNKLIIDDLQTDYQNEFNINISKKDLRGKLSMEGLNVVANKGYYYIKGFKREEKVRDDDNDEPKSALDILI